MIPEEVMRRFYSDQFPAEIREIVIYYFDYYYSICPIFHPATFMCRLVNGNIDPFIIEVMRARAARVISKHTGRVIDLESTIETINSRLLLDMENPTFDSVRATVLMTTLSGGEARFMSYNMLAALASSSVAKMGWHRLDMDAGTQKTHSWREWAQLETQRRSFWLTYLLDTYQAVLNDRPVSINDGRIYTALPGSDCTWDDITISQLLNWPTRHKKNIDKQTVIATGSLSYALVDMSILATLYRRMSELMWSIKRGARFNPATSPARVDIVGFRRGGGPAVTIKESLFECPEFVSLHTALSKWKNGLIVADEMKGIGRPLEHLSQFGNLEHRRYMIRIRYFCLYAYYVPTILILHLMNRPSYFHSPQQQQENAPAAAAAGVSSRFNVDSFLGPDFVDNTSLIRAMMSTSFSSTMNDSLLAYDVIPESWEICLDAIDDMCCFLDRNDDIPTERYDHVLMFSIFSAITVLVRHICKSQDSSSRGGASGVNIAKFGIPWSVRTLRSLWERLKSLGFVSGAGGMEVLLRKMHVEEVANAAELFASMCL
ncbi:hypothetical protein LPJ66_001552 [Kickxella alabastrina]|uniref:Uncharacterized protein n=1 Tax=Kickxella alabastrina TaxID=61397 RepID=A0ACC1ISW9_9FUNG|nr:hypothetical protein LPJ66_001552 [Kickxella alabastrina]